MAAPRVQASRSAVSSPILRVRCQLCGVALRAVRAVRGVGALAGTRRAAPTRDAAPARYSSATSAKVPADVSVTLPVCAIPSPLGELGGVGALAGTRLVMLPAGLP